MARKFLYLLAFLIFLVIAAALAFKLWPNQLMQMALVPKGQFETQPVAAPNAYADPARWVAQPQMTSNNPASWLPKGLTEDSGPHGQAAIFFVHPTSYMNRAHWNAPLNDRDADPITLVMVRGLASAFNNSGDIWAPRYRQATIGAFMTDDKATATKAFDLAYGDVAQSFDEFLRQAGPDRPIILAGHSQGAFHLMRLMRERVAGQPLAKRIVAAYIVGWPVSVQHDLPAMGLPACTTANQRGCVLSWMTFGEPADPGMLFASYDDSTGFDGQSRRGSAALCVNPLTGTQDGEASASSNLGMIRLGPTPESMDNGAFDAKGVPARCDKQRGLLLIGKGPDLGRYVLPGNNYHVFDMPLFWANVRADAARRLAAR